MSQQSNSNYPVTILSFKKSAKGTVTLKPAKGLKMFLDGKEVQFEIAEVNGNSGQFLYVNKVDDEIQRLQSLSSENKIKPENAEKMIGNLEQQKEWGITSFVKAKLK